MLNEKIVTLLNEQVNKEFYSSYLYLDFANYYEAKGLSGFANWYQIQAKEESDHGHLCYRYLHNNGHRVQLDAIAKPDVPLEDLMGPLKAAMQHEIFITNSINTIYAAAQELHDYRTVQFLDWFVKEQGEEETNASNLITRMELFGGDAKSLYMLDSELGARVYSAPSLVL